MTEGQFHSTPSHEDLKYKWRPPQGLHVAETVYIIILGLKWKFSSALNGGYCMISNSNKMKADESNLKKVY